MESNWFTSSFRVRAYYLLYCIGICILVFVFVFRGWLGKADEGCFSLMKTDVEPFTSDVGGLDGCPISHPAADRVDISI